MQYLSSFRPSLLSILLLLSLTSYSQIPTSSLVGYWPFSGNANDASGNGLNGVVYGATLTTDRFGNPNSAYSFDGVSNYIDLSMWNFGIAGNAPRTIMAWIKTTDPNYGRILATGQTVVGHNPAYNCQTFNLVHNGSYLGVMGYQSTGNNNCDFYPTTGKVINDGQWHLVLASYDGSTVRTYVDGVFDNMQTATYTTTGNGNYIAKSNNIGSEDYFPGVIDDIKIYARALDTTEITALYNENICYQNVTVTDTLKINTTITSYNPVTYLNTIKVYPNPTNDHITIDYGNYSKLSGYTLKITNSLGSLVYSTVVTQQQSYLSLSSFGGKGLYFIYLNDQNGNLISTKKIVLE